MDLVFGVERFHLTFALKPEGFEVVALPPYDPFDQDNDNCATKGEHQEDSSQKNKKSKTTNSTNATSSSSGPSTGPSPMQLSATPFGKGPMPPKRILFSKANRQQQVAFTPLPKGPESGKGLQDRSIAQCMTNHGSQQRVQQLCNFQKSCWALVTMVLVAAHRKLLVECWLATARQCLAAHWQHQLI